MSKTRNDIQDECFDHWLDHNCRTMVNVATGLGKTLIMIRAVEYSLANSDLPALIVCHSEESRDVTIPDEFKKFHKEHLLERCVLICYKSLPKYTGNYSIAACDEAHYLTEANVTGLYSSWVERVILLTATLPPEEEKIRIIERLTEGRFYLHVDTAIENNIVNDYKIYVYYTDFDDNNLVKPYKTKPAMPESRAYQDLCNKIEYFQSTGQYQAAEMTRLKRMHFIYDLESKKQAALKIKNLFQNKRYVIFCGSTRMADQLSPYRYHSKSSREDYERFLQGDIDELASVRKIKEGANIPELDGAIIVQLNSKELNITQMIGRLLRGKPGEVKPVVVIVNRNSVDYHWFQKAIANFDPSKIRELRL